MPLKKIQEFLMQFTGNKSLGGNNYLRDFWQTDNI